MYAASQTHNGKSVVAAGGNLDHASKQGRQDVKAQRKRPSTSFINEKFRLNVAATSAR
jgi:hypothetical protein